MIDPATGWLEMREIKTKRADIVADIVERAWMTRYPWPVKIILDRGKEFMAEFSKMMQNDYGIRKRPITVRNPQANSILERIHQTIGNMIRTFRMHESEIDEEDPWSGILSAVMFATRATIHTTMQATPMQLVFGRDAILNVKYETNWKYIKDRKQKIIDENNKRENSRRIPHDYKVGDKVMVKQDPNQKYGDDTYKGPYEVVKVNKNGTLVLRIGAKTYNYNL